MTRTPSNGRNAALTRQGLRASGCEMLRLTVNPRNATAIAPYESAGFEMTDTDDDGELRVMKPLSSSLTI